jgi:hypothetical protein
METKQLLFWRPAPSLKLSPAETARELMWGEEVEGLVDLPIREIIDRLKAHYPQHDEKPGQLAAMSPDGSFQVTWTWQHIRIDCHDVSAAVREELIEVIEAFDCMAYEPKEKTL